jgi:hypothetical protein
MIISGEDRYGREVQWLIRFLPLCVESEHEHYSDSLLLPKCFHCFLTCVWKILQALLHASVDCRRKLVIEWVASTDLEDSTAIEVQHNPLQITAPYVPT